MVAYVGASAPVFSAGASSFTYPVGIADEDVVLIHVTTVGGSAFTMDDVGWIEIATSDAGTGADSCRTTVLRSTYAAGSPLPLGFGDPGNHMVGFVTAWRDVNPSDPIDVFTTDSSVTGDVSHSAVGPNTTETNTMVVITGSHGVPVVVTLGDEGNLDSALTEIDQESTTLGNDGTVFAAYSTMTSASAVGALLWTTDVLARRSAVVVALTPAGAPAAESDLVASSMMFSA